ncbi:MAG: hypothetical protein DYG93_12285 [Leptolyngbya sp. PLA2]|nr:hypothetical protein [Leptolyngbya sp.]MCE7972422.1 hypothetical protein [Leptolyngbya sp. PL-A2]MCZ7634230.1 hypothetical protein [Phycisphaerales bacterium]MDL1905821.1 hypothetical protein [Synechococcales cyanobacterium CNB]GIK19387.1 MAG: hypothetical protein BroJett004_15510 [Planctomycetota bacterium]
MSAKWRRSLKWDDEHFPAWAWPVKFVLRAFSSITLAVILLSGVVLYGVVASVPLGLLALGPTWLLYGITLVVTAGLPAAALLLIARFALRGASRGVRFVVGLAGSVVGAGIGAMVWGAAVWPAIHFDPATGSGVRLFASFVREYESITVRRLPGVEMSELEFYSAWPMRLLLLAFVLNMVVATVRRIEFVLVNLGVLTVHTGIVMIALGSVYYQSQKREGDAILLAGAPDERGVPRTGAPVGAFYDNTHVALYVSQYRGWEQRPVRGVPRYNDYGLDLGAGESALSAAGRGLSLPEGSDRRLSIPVPPSSLGMTDGDVRLRIVGYASYAEARQDWLRAPPPSDPARANPLRIVELHTDVPDPQGRVRGGAAFSYTLMPASPPHRVADNGVFGVEYVRGMEPWRWADLTAELPSGTTYALSVEVVGWAGPVRVVRAVQAGESFEVEGWRIAVEEVTPEPPFPIITPGYRGASSSVALVRVEPPAGAEHPEPFTRYVYHRYPEIAQDILEVARDDGRPVRRDADASIRLGLIDASQLQVYFDEPEGASTPEGVRAVVRLPGGAVRVVDSLGPGGRLERIIPDAYEVTLVVAAAWEHAEAFERPVPVPEVNRDRSMVGTHDKAMVAVEVSVPAPDDPLAEQAPGVWSTVVWLPFDRYPLAGVFADTQREVRLPDGRRVALIFGRRQHPLPGFEVSLVDFQMLSYDHRGAPRDYQSIVRVTPTTLDFEPYEHVAKLNEPLRAPWRWDDRRSWVANVATRLSAGLDPRQFKFSQAGWDAEGWRRTQEMADQGLVPRPFAQFTILQVGNNPGIHVIAGGGILMGVGIPWAFYVKPLILQRRKRRIQRELAEGTYRPPVRLAPTQAVQPAGAEP